MLLKTTVRQNDAHFEQAAASTHSLIFPNNSIKELAGCFKGQQLFALGTREFLQEISDTIQRGRQIIFNGLLDAKFENPGLLVICDNLNHRIYVQTDLVGLYPAFWTVHDSGFAISNSLSQLHTAFPGETDDAGVIEFLRLDYTIGPRTQFKNIKRLQPGESLCFNSDTMKINLADLSDLWTQQYTDYEKQIVSSACEMLVESCKPMKHTMLMMSGGWDSRTLLAGAYKSGLEKQVVLYHHGDAQSREARIVKKLTTRLDLKLIMGKLSASIYQNDFLEESFGYSENILYPHWHAAAHIAAQPENGIESVCAGIFGEVIGGHYGPPMLLNGWKKIVSTFGYLGGIPGLARRYNTANMDDSRGASALLHESPYPMPWYVNGQLWLDRFKSINESVNADIEQAVSRYISRGIKKRESIIEAFITENRGGQTIASQLRSAATLKPLLAPFATRKFLQFACSLPYEQKANNSLNRIIIRKLYPGLLNYPTAAILCKTSRPILMQEATRAVRKAWERGLWKMYKRSKGKFPAPNLGWPNFQFLCHTNVINELIDSLHSPLWDKKRMIDFTNQYGYSNYHELQDVLMRIKTLDLSGVI